MTVPEVIARCLIARELVVWTRQPVVADLVAGWIARYLIARELVVWTRQPVVADLVAGCASTGEVRKFSMLLYFSWW